jgi:hypothetical protein
VQKLYEIRYLCTSEIDLQQYLIAASSIGFLYTCNSKPKFFSEVSLVPQVNKLLPIKKQYLLDLQYFPLLLTQLQHNMLMWDLKARIGLDAPVEFVKTACSCPSAQMESNFERMEMFGDSYQSVMVVSSRFIFLCMFM